MGPEERARQQIDALLAQAGWQVQDYDAFNLSASGGIVIREFPLSSGTADYLLFANRKAVGVIEAKSIGTTLSGVADQSAKYTTGLPEHVRGPIPLPYESTDIEACFRDMNDACPCLRRVFSFHRPETLADWVSQGDTLRARLAGSEIVYRDWRRTTRIRRRSLPKLLRIRVAPELVSGMQEGSRGDAASVRRQQSRETASIDRLESTVYHKCHRKDQSLGKCGATHGDHSAC